MKFPEKYIEYGEFVLHSGKASKIRYNVCWALTDRIFKRHTIYSIPQSEHYVGISTGGAIITGMIGFGNLDSDTSFVKDGKLMGEIPSGDYLLIDDVATTEGSLKEAIGIIGRLPSEIWVCVDRRSLECRTLDINHVFEI